MTNNMVFTLRPFGHTFVLWQRSLALVQSPVVQTSLASFWGGVVKTFRCGQKPVGTYYFYHISPADDADCLSIDDVVTRVAGTFPRHEISAEEAHSDAKKRLTALEGLNAPEEICRIYRDGKPVRCRIAAPDGEGYLEFDVWENQGIQVFPYPKDVENCCLPLANKLAELLGYRLTCEEYD